MTTELARRIAITIGALLIYRLGTQIPIAGLDVSRLSSFPSLNGRLSLFALGLIPYLTAAIFVRLLSVVWRGLSSLERSGENGRGKVARATLVLTLALAAFQAYGIASTLISFPELVRNPDGWFVVTATASMVGGVFALVWLSEQITRHGIGNGLALILSVGMLVSLPRDVAGIADVVRSGAVSGNLVFIHAVFWAVTVAVIVLVEGARRNVRVAFGALNVGARQLPARDAVLPIKLNSAGFLIPVSVAPWIFYLPLAFAGFVLGGDHPLVAATYRHLQLGQPAHMILVSIAVFALAFVYTAYVVDPEYTAETLARHRGTIPGIAPGEATAAHLDRVVSLTTVVGAVYLTALQLIPEVFDLYGIGLPYSMVVNGGAALVVVCTVLDIKTQVRDVSLTNPGGVRR
ncbi:preprotein translocase subunit SecY [Bradyrhizobium sp. KB893862 SZCCT0404]|uniref:preprotein translocase subunit SecY n=1 Tax=Bradyrhizobium sp. KB893862 SZCCT0404 TaxID=2807672 RepID=UPI001BAB1D2F|nr:preprotein translocase subunit SecY [Bradyrhizobium sp. KB893862 SZCCT0404]MBR1172932.1 preprotein translocase subunit SecY [Bradyrhizobium sp. KB893862 SZCCT0404]